MQLPFARRANKPTQDAKSEILTEKREFILTILVHLITIVVKNCEEGNGLLAINATGYNLSIFVFEDLTAVKCYKKKYIRDVRKAHADLMSLRKLL